MQIPDVKWVCIRDELRHGVLQLLLVGNSGWYFVFTC